MKNATLAAIRLLGSLAIAGIAVLSASFSAPASAVDIFLGDEDIFIPNGGIFSDTYNSRFGDNRFGDVGFGGTDQVVFSIFVFPSQDSDPDNPNAIGSPGGGDRFFATNGNETSVSISHPSVALPSGAAAQQPGRFGGLSDPDDLAFCGPGANPPNFCGGGFDEYIYHVDRSLLSQSDLDAIANEGIDVTITNSLAPTNSPVTFKTAPAADPGNLSNSIAYDPTSLPDFVTDKAITGGGLEPTVSWTIPCLADGDGSDCNHNGVLFQVRRFEFDAAGEVTNSLLVHNEFFADPTKDEFDFAGVTLSQGLPGDGSLREGEVYEVNVILTDVDNGHLAGRSNSFFEFTPLPADTPDGVAIFLPTVTRGADFVFDVEVAAGETIFVDPLVAIGYDYAVGAGDPLFASVLLPELNGSPTLYDLVLYDGLDNEILTGIEIASLTLFDFLTDPALLAFGDFVAGIDKFGIRGIPLSAGLDPNDATAFITGLQFVSDGRFTGTMTPITAEVPGPSTLSLLAAGIVGAGFVAWRRRNRRITV